MVFAPFLITFREALEAALIITIIIAYLTKIGRKDLHKYAWFGSLAAIGGSIGIGVIVLLFFGALEGVAEKLFEGTAALLATAVLTSMIFWMAKNSKNLKGKLQHKIDITITKKFLLGISVLAFIAIFREGVETVLFLTPLFGIDFQGTLYGMLGGIIVVLVLSFFLLKGTARLPLQTFFKYTSVILIVFAAGLFGFGIHEYIEAGEELGVGIGIFGQSAFNINPAEGHILHEKGAVGSIFKALVGYDGNPEWLRVFGYFGYWMVIGFFVRRVFKAPVIAKPPLTAPMLGNGKRPAIR